MIYGGRYNRHCSKDQADHEVLPKSDSESEHRKHHELGAYTYTVTYDDVG